MKNTKAMALVNLEKIKVTDHEETMSGLNDSQLKTLLILFILVIFTLTASAQKPVVLSALSKHGIDAAVLNANNIQKPDGFTFDLKQTTITAGKQAVIMASFDPSKSKEEQWTVVSADGKSPSKSDIKTFRKNHDTPPVITQTDESSYKIEKETPDQLVISYKQDPSSIPKDAAFMKDCRFYLTVNLQTKRLEQVQALNEKPLKIKILTAEKFDLIAKYRWNDQAKNYVPEREDLNMLAKFLGQSVSVQTITEYSNYTKK